MGDAGWNLDECAPARRVERVMIAGRGVDRYVREWKGSSIGRPYDIAIGPDGNAFIIDGGDQPDAPPDRASDHRDRAVAACPEGR